MAFLCEVDKYLDNVHAMSHASFIVYLLLHLRSSADDLAEGTSLFNVIMDGEAVVKVRVGGSDCAMVAAQQGIIFFAQL